MSYQITFIWKIFIFQIDVDEFRAIFEKSKNHYPDAPIVWLKELVQFLNQKVPIEVQDHVFASKPEGYPLNLVSFIYNFFRRY